MSLTADNQAQMLVQVSQSGSLGRIHLNRPEALNSLTLDMVRIISWALKRFETNASIAAVLITGEGERAFCAGGDIRALYNGGPDNTTDGRTFWREEYSVNAHIKRYRKPYIAFMDAITMGGGVGVSAHGSHRIVTERTRLAMPETGIGFFPDVGGTWLLSRGKGGTGTYLALTGEEINASDAIQAGLADFYMLSSLLPELIDHLSKLPKSADADAVTEAINSLTSFVSPGPVALNEAEINATFGFNTVEEIIAALQNSRSVFARNTLETLNLRSPTSLKLTLKMLGLARQDMAFEQTLEREYAAAAAVLTGHDFYEGVRAAIIDKDRNPKWQPATLEAVSNESLERYFAPAPEQIFE